MKILFLTTHLNSGGITSYLRTLSAGLMKLGHEVHILSSGGETQEAFRQSGARILTLDIRTKSALSFKIYKNLGTVAAYIKKNNIDILHAQTRVTQIMGKLLQQKTGTVCVTTCHGFFRPKFSRRLFPCWGEGVIAISEPVVEHLKRDFHLSPDRVALIHNGIDLDKFPAISAEIRAENRRTLGFFSEPVIGSIARLSDIKGLDLLIHAVKKIVPQLSQVKLVIVGQGKWEEKLKNLTTQLDLEDQVHFLPVTDQTYKFLTIFDVFVMPSRQEGLGLSVMEAQAAGLPVVVTKVGGLTSLVQDGTTGLLVEPEQVDHLARAILLVLNDRKLARTMGENAREFIHRRYSAEKMVRETVEFYQKMIEKAR